MTNKEKVVESKKMVASVNAIAPDINLCAFPLSVLMTEIAEGEAAELEAENLRVLASASVVRRYNSKIKLTETINGTVCAIRASRHPKKDEVLRAIGYKLPWEFGNGGAEEEPALPMPPPPSGISPLAV